MTLFLGAPVIVDYNTFGQDVQNVAQVGSISSETEMRAGRLMPRGAPEARPETPSRLQIAKEDGLLIVVRVQTRRRITSRR